MKKLFLLLVILILFGCQQQDPEYSFEQESIEVEGLDYDQDSILASIPSVVLEPSDIVFEDGETVEDFLKRYDPNSLKYWGKTFPMENGRIKSANVFGTTGVDGFKKFFSDVASAGNFVCNNEKQLNPEGIGYAYVFNNNRSLNVKKKAGNCDINLFGIDCSGFVMNMLETAGVNFENKRLLAANLATPGTINSSLQNSPLTDYQYDDYTKIPISEIKNGDLIYFKEIIWKRDDNGKIITEKDATGKKVKQILKLTDKVEHIGIAAVSKGTLCIYQSNGTQFSPGCSNYSHSEVNGKGRGPRCIPVSNFLSIIDFSNYGVLRLVPKKQNTNLKGNWKLTGEKTEVIAGPKRFLAKSVNLTNIRLSIPDINNFHIDADDPDDPDNPFSESGHYSLSKDNDQITLSGVELYERDPNTAKIITLTDKKFVISFFLMSTGFTQVSTLYFEKY